jgi:hypothetical protein
MSPEMKNNVPQAIVSHRTVSSRYLMIRVPTMIATIARINELCNVFIGYAFIFLQK